MGGKGHCSGDGGRRGSKEAAPKSLRGLEWQATSLPGGGHGWRKSGPGARHSWPLIWATRAHSSNLLPLPILRALSLHGCCGRGELGELAPGHQGSGEPPGLVMAPAAFLAGCSAGGVRWGGGRDEREEGRGEQGETVKKGERERN